MATSRDKRIMASKPTPEGALLMLKLTLPEFTEAQLAELQARVEFEMWDRDADKIDPEC